MNDSEITAGTCPVVGRRRINTRRDVLIGGAAGLGAVTAGGLLAGCSADDPFEMVATATEMNVYRVSRVPVDDPVSSRWTGGPLSGRTEVTVALEGQTLVAPRRPDPSVPTVSVAAVHDGETIGFRLRWTDEQVDDLTIATDAFRDACAVMLTSALADPAVRFMGTESNPATIIHWKADWQRDVDLGFQGLSVEFPNGTFDYYPPLGPSDGQAPSPDDYTEKDAEQWLPGMAAGNPLSQPNKTSPVEKAVARSVGTLESLPNQNAIGHGLFADGGWNVVLAKPLAAVDADEVALAPGGHYAMAIAIWSGRAGDVGGHKSPSTSLLTLNLEP